MDVKIKVTIIKFILLPAALSYYSRTFRLTELESASIVTLPVLWQML